jgi:hypothetical protein
MVSLSNLLFLTEGMLKVPPKILAELTSKARSILSLKLLLIFNENQKTLNEISSSFAAAKREIKNFLENSSIEDLNSRKQTFLRRGIAYSYKSHSKKLYTPVKQIRGATFLIARKDENMWALQIASQRSVWYESHLIFVDNIPDLTNKILFELNDYFSYYDQLIKPLSEAIKPHVKNLLKQGANLKGISYYDKDDIYQEITLSPEWFEGWNPGNKELDVSILTGDKLKIFYIYDETYPHEGYITSRSDGSWKINIKLPAVRKELINSPNYFEDAFNSIADTIEHALRHFAQEALTIIKTGKDYDELEKEGKEYEQYGLPTKKVHYGADKKPDLKARLIQASELGVPHELQDTEFYTRLGDSIANMKRKLEYLANPQDRKLKFVRLVGQTTAPFTDPWFAFLLANHYKKWRQAVSIAYEELRKDGLL